TLNLRPDALSRKPEDTPKSMDDDRLKARHRELIDLARFDPGFPDPPAVTLARLAALTTELVCDEDIQVYTLDVMDGKSTDDLIRDSYNSSMVMKDIVA
ncbi:hypothetical protein N0V85_009980, partial [Neurospora sp. IMI 360204]